jgi:hypothetical protein
MFWTKRNKEPERFYLLAGMGGKAFRRKNRIFLAWSLVAGLMISICFGLALYYVNVHH